MSVIGIDIGSTSIKGVLLEPPWQALAVAGSDLPPALPSAPGRHELDARAVRQATASVLERLRRQDVRGICFTGQMHGGLLVDADEEPLTPFVTWQDQRGDLRGIHNQVSPAAWDDVGGRVQSGFLGATLHWYLQQGLPAATAGVRGIYDWLAATLLGVPPYTDPSSAAAWGLYSLREESWSEEVLRAIGIPHALLPRVVPSGELVGSTAAGLSVYSGIGDTQAAYLGSGCSPQEVLINIGTGSQLMFETSDSASFGGTDVRYMPAARFLRTVPTLAGGRAYAILAGFFGDALQSFGQSSADLYDRMNQIAANAPSGADGVTFTPLFAGSRFLGEELRASIQGLSPSNFTAANICRALLEGMIDEITTPYEALPAVHRTHVGIVGAGNGMRRNRALQEAASQRLRLPLRLSENAEEAAVGAARLASGAFQSPFRQAG